MSAPTKNVVALPVATTVERTDKILLVDISDTTEGPAGTVKVSHISTVGQVFGPYISQAENAASEAESHVLTSQNNAAAAAASAASIADYSARVQAMLKARGITNIKAIAFKSAEGWELTGNQSYKTEARPAGRFLGDYANATAAWAANYQGVATVAGDYYWQTSGTIGLFECTTSNASSRHYRAGSDHLPLEAVFVVAGSTTPTLYIFDLTDPLVPLWGQFAGSPDTGANNHRALGVVAAVTAMKFKDGALHIAKGIHSTNYTEGLITVDFIKDVITTRAQSISSFGFFDGLSVFNGTISSRNSTAGFKQIDSSYNMAGVSVNDIATHKGYIAAATAGGLSVIKPDGTVVKSATTSVFLSVQILNGRLYAVNDSSPDALLDYGPIESLGASFTSINGWSSSLVPPLSGAALLSLGKADNSLVIGQTSSVDQFWPNPADKESSLIARRGTTFATPPMKKPEVMLICSTVEGSVSDAELVTNGTFDTDTTGWNAQSSAVLSIESSKLRVTNSGDNFSYGSQTLTTVAGVTYKVTFDYTLGTSSSAAVRVGTALGGSQLGALTVSSTGTYSVVFTATSTTSFLALINLQNVDTRWSEWDNVSAKAIVQDFSGKSNHATINGTLTATAEVAGGVAGLSGFSASNYLSVPYDADLQVSTGDILIPFAFKCTGNSAVETLVARGDTGMASARLEIFLQAGGTVRVAINGTAVVTTASVYDDSLVHTGLFYRRSGTAFLEIDGQVIASAANTTDLNNATAIYTVGIRPDTALPATTSTIWFAGASAASPSQSEAALMHTHMRNLILGKAALDEIPSALAYDPIRQAVEMVGATKRQTMQDGAIVASVNHGQGTSPAVAVGPRSEIGIGGSTGVSISVPQRNLREYQARKTTERFTIDYVADGTETLFPNPANSVDIAKTIGAKPVQVVDAGEFIPEDVAGWTVADYGLGRMVPKFAVAPSNTNIVSVTFEREVYK